MDAGTDIGFLNKSKLLRFTQGLLSAFAKKSDLVSLLTQDKELVDFTVVPTWTGLLSGETTLSGVAEVGTTVTFDGSWSWVHADTLKDPTVCSGSWGSTLPDSGVSSGSLASVVSYTNTGVSETHTMASQTIEAPRAGLMVSGDKIVKAFGNDSVEHIVCVTFGGYQYFGKASTAQYVPGVTVIDTEFIKGLTQIGSMSVSLFTSEKSGSYDSVNVSDSEYVFFAYPASFGDLSEIYVGSMFNQIEAFTKSTFTYVGSQSQDVVYNVYISSTPGIVKGGYVNYR